MVYCRFLMLYYCYVLNGILPFINDILPLLNDIYSLPLSDSTTFSKLFTSLTLSFILINNDVIIMSMHDTCAWNM